MTRLKAYIWTDIDVGFYRRPQEVQIISTMVEYLQDIQMSKEARVQCKNGSGNPAIEYEHFTRADNTHMKYDIYSNALWGQYYYP
jgi:hypothetical protein